MEENKEFNEKLSLINEKIASDSEEKHLEAIQEFNDLLNGELVRKYIIDENNKFLKNLHELCFADYEKFKEELGEENKNLNTKNSKKIILQKIFNKSVKNNLAGIFKYIMENHKQEVNIKEKITIIKYYKNNFEFDIDKPLISIACENKEDEIFKILLSDTEINLNVLDTEESNNIFIIACKKGKLDYVELILKEVKNRNKKIDININNGKPLREACLSGNTELVKYLLSFKDIEIDLKDKFKNTIFMSACRNENKDYRCVELLYEEYKNRQKEFNINEENTSNYTAIYYACLYNNIDLVKYLLLIPGIDNIKNFNFFSTACCHSNIEIVQLLYNRFCDRIDENIITNSLSYAINSKKVEIIEYLLSVVPDIESKIIFNKSNLIDSFEGIIINNKCENSLKILKLLFSKLSNKLDEIYINLTTQNEGNTPLHRLCNSCNCEMIEFLLSQEWKGNIDINAINKEGKTPFIIACKEGYFNIAKMLYDRPDFDKEKNKFDNNKKTDCIKYFKKNVNIIDESKGLTDNQTRTFRKYENLKEDDMNYTVITDVVYNVDDTNKEKKLYEIKYNGACIYSYPKTITFFISDKTFTATITERANIEFNFDGFNDKINSEDFEKEINKILNSFKNVNCFDTYLSWLSLALIKFKKEEKEEIQKEENKRNNSNKIEYFYIYHNMNGIKKIIDNNLEDKKENKILICDFSFSAEELETKDKSGHAIPLVIFNGKDANGNPKTKILAFNTGFESKKAFKKLQEKLGDDVEIVKIDKDLSQKYGSCIISPKPMIEALFSSFMDELKEGESLVGKLDQYSKDMVIANRLAKLYEEHDILSKIRNEFFKILEKLDIIESIQDLKNMEKTENTKSINIMNRTESSLEEQKIENKKEILKNINLEEYLGRLKKYKMINEILTKKYKLLYGNYMGLYLDYNNGLGASMPLNDDLNKAIKEVKKEQIKREEELNKLALTP